jgi:hypothetical protein
MRMGKSGMEKKDLIDTRTAFSQISIPVSTCSASTTSSSKASLMTT